MPWQTNGGERKGSYLMEKEASTNPRRLVLDIQVPGNVPSFKNNKRAVIQHRLSNEGKPFAKIILDPKTAERMEAIIQSIVFALCIEYQTRGSATGTGCNLPSWIASSVPLNDSFAWIPESGGWTVEYVEPGKEGVVIILEEILPSETKEAINASK